MGGGCRVRGGYHSPKPGIAVLSQELFISEVSSNHAQSLERCMDFIDVSADIGCDAVKFQLFRIEELFAPEILKCSEEHRRRKHWELPVEFLKPLAERSHKKGMQFSCTPFYLEAVEEMLPYVDFYKIASYEMPWDDLIRACAQTGKPLVMSTGMAYLEEVAHAVEVFEQAGGRDLTLLHCISGYPTPLEQCNLSAIATLRDAFGCKVGWSDHSRNPLVVSRAIEKWGASVIEFHLDIDGAGAEYETGHCWLPEEIAPVIAFHRQGTLIDGSGEKAPTAAEIEDRPWRASPDDGLRPNKSVRAQWASKS